MTILKAADNTDIEQCDGCGRTDGGPGTSLGIKPFVVHDPNVGGAVQHHYCVGCAGNRGLGKSASIVPGWTATAAPLVVTEEPVIEAIEGRSTKST